MRLTIIIFYSLIFFADAQSQSEPASPSEIPPGPMITNNLGDFAQWMITIKPLSEPAKQVQAAGQQPTPPPLARVVQTVVLTKTLPLIRIQRADSSKVIEERWIVGNTQIVNSTMTLPYISNPYGGASDLSYTQSDFPELGWISAGSYVGTVLEKATGRKVMAFKGFTIAKDSDGNEVKSPATAVVDFQTRLPISSQDDFETRTYQFGRPPAQMLVLPKSVENTLKRESENNAVVNRPAGKQ